VVAHRADAKQRNTPGFDVRQIPSGPANVEGKMEIFFDDDDHVY